MSSTDTQPFNLPFTLHASNIVAMQDGYHLCMDTFEYHGWGFECNRHGCVIWSLATGHHYKIASQFVVFADAEAAKQYVDEHLQEGI